MRRFPRFRTVTGLVELAGLAICAVALSTSGLLLRGASSDSESVVLSVTIVAAGSGSSASSAASSSVASSAASSVVASAAVSETGVRPGGGNGVPPPPSQPRPAAPEPPVIGCLRAIVQETYSDVREGAWYEESVWRFLCWEYLDAREPRFRPAAPMNRAEVATILTRIFADTLPPQPTASSFTDITPDAWYARFTEHAAAAGWFLGDDNCYGRTPCTFRPADPITRAELAAVLVRAHQLPAATAERVLLDVPAYAWYADIMQAAAEHCLLLGDDATGLMRPEDAVNRAEAVVMIDRSLLGYARDCRAPALSSRASNTAEASTAPHSSSAFSVQSAASDMQSSQSITERLPLSADPPLESLSNKAGARTAAPALVLPQCTECHRCGEGLFSFCTAAQCFALGDCTAHPGFLFLSTCIPHAGLCE